MLRSIMIVDNGINARGAEKCGSGFPLSHEEQIG